MHNNTNTYHLLEGLQLLIHISPFIPPWIPIEPNTIELFNTILRKLFFIVRTPLHNDPRPKSVSFVSLQWIANIYIRSQQGCYIEGIKTMTYPWYVAITIL